MLRTILTGIITLILSLQLHAQVSIIPAPAEVIIPKPSGNFTIGAATRIIVYPGLQKSADYFKDYLQRYYGLHLTTAASGAAGNTITLQHGTKASITKGAYTLLVTASGITINSQNEQGIFYGIQSLVQLLPMPENASVSNSSPRLSIPFVSIRDYPRFAYRGMHLDVARHFFPVAFIKKYIDYLALHKMNTFHWHLTDDQGWRIEIKKYPRLTEVGGYRNGTIIGHYPGTGNDNTPYDGFYTQAQIKEIVQYAADRYITVIPEIEMPGHASAAIAAYPQLSCFPDSATIIPGPASIAGNQKSLKKVQETWGVFDDVFCPSQYTFTFLQNVLDEVMALFPSKYIHIGGDECPKDAWKRSAFCQDLIKQQNLKDEAGLQSYFIQRIEKYVNSKGRRIIGWDEILEGGLAPDATVMSWRGEEGGVAAATQGHDVVMTPGAYVYFDHSQVQADDSLTIGGYTSTQKVYRYQPVPKALNASQAQHILGAQANLWTEYITNPGKVEYQIFPRMSALSEVLWSKDGTRSWSDFESRLRTQVYRYQLWKAQYSNAFTVPDTTEAKTKKH